MKGVFEISGSSRYDDFISERYHFPSKYLPVAEKLIGDWVVFRETRSAKGRMSYIAVGRVIRIDPDLANPSHYYARIDEFLEFDTPVAYRDKHGRFAEGFLRELPQVADAGRSLRGLSVRTLEAADFVAIVNAGLAETLAPENRRRLDLDRFNVDPATQLLLDSALSERKIEQVLLNRKIRDASFRNHVLAAYDNTCAVTGLQFINGGGRAEAQAAHICPVADGGPDIVQNGLALSATVHWLFDRHLISLDGDLRLLVSHNKVPPEFRQLFPCAGAQIRLPKDETLHPRRDFVVLHRERFSGSN